MVEDEDLTQYPDAIDDENRHRAPSVGAPGLDDVDLWEPTDDVDEIEDETERRLRWRIVAPSGEHVHTGGEENGGFQFHCRTDALSWLWAPSFGVSKETLAKLHALNHEVAGWSKIDADGWTIEPQPVPTDG